MHWLGWYLLYKPGSTTCSQGRPIDPGEKVRVNVSVCECVLATAPGILLQRRGLRVALVSARNTHGCAQAAEEMEQDQVDLPVTGAPVRQKGSHKF